MSKQTPNKSNLNVTPTGDVIVDYFHWLNEPEEQPRKEKLNYLAALINHYRQIEFLDRYKNAGFENMNEAVYCLLGGEYKYVDRIVEYRMEAQNLLRLLATPKVMDVIKEACPYFDGSAAEMLHALIDFFNTLDGAPHRTMLQIHHMLQDPPEDDRKIEQLTIEYEERIRSAASGKVRNHY